MSDMDLLEQANTMQKMLNELEYPLPTDANSIDVAFAIPGAALSVKATDVRHLERIWNAISELFERTLDNYADHGGSFGSGDESFESGVSTFASVVGVREDDGRFERRLVEIEKRIDRIATGPTTRLEKEGGVVEIRDSEGRAFANVDIRNGATEGDIEAHEAQMRANADFIANSPEDVLYLLSHLKGTLDTLDEISNLITPMEEK